MQLFVCELQEYCSSLSLKSKGQGFGLTVVKRVLEAMNGTVSFESEEGKGTKFISRLPLQAAKL
jgi:signal transduction histidine kinase